MKRIIVLIGVVLGLSGWGLIPAHAGSQESMHCNDGGPYFTREIVTSPVYLAVEEDHSSAPTGLFQLCYSDTRFGSTAPTVAGGKILVHYGPNGTSITCGGENPATFTLDCTASAGFNTTDPQPGLTSPGMTATATATAFTTTANVGQTGAEAGRLTTGTGSTATVTDGNTCIWVNGGVVAPTVFGNCSANALNARAATGDVGTGSGSLCLLKTNGVCTLSVPTRYVTTGGDSTNNTVDGNVFVVPVTQDTGTRCVGVCP